MINGAKTAQDWNEWEGRIIDGKFPLLKYLGGTQRSAVFLTERPEGEPRTAAIKLLTADDSVIEAQLARWMASAQLSHPDLLRMFEIGSGADGPVKFAYVVMEYAEENLAQVARPLTEAEAIDMLKGVLEALAFLHGQRLAHGHLKPSNILAMGDQLKISSDTIRPAGEWLSNLDVPGPYDPPELAREGATSSGDIWSVGVTLIVALTKRMPSWDGDVLAVSLLTDFPPRLRVPVSSCLRVDPGDRSTAGGLSNLLQSKAEVLEGSRSEPSRPGMGKGRYLIVAGAVGLALAAAAILPRLTGDRVAGTSSAVEPPELKSGPVTTPAKPPEVQRKAAVANAPAKTSGQEVLTEVLPDVPARARDTIRGKVAINLRVRVGANGLVVDARNESPQSSRYFGNLALQAARRWKFAPTDAGSPARPAEWNLQFRFVRDASHPVSVKAVPIR